MSIREQLEELGVAVAHYNRVKAEAVTGLADEFSAAVDRFNAHTGLRVTSITVDYVDCSVTGGRRGEDMLARVSVDALNEDER